VYRERGKYASDTGDKETAELYEHVAGEEDHHKQEFQQRGMHLTTQYSTTEHLPSFERRYPNEADKVELINLYHTARIAGKESRYDRMLWVADEFVKKHPEWTKASAYKAIDEALQHPEIKLPQTKKKYWVKINDPGATSFTQGSLVSWEEFKEEDRRVRGRGEKPASVEIVKEPAPGNGNGDKHLPATNPGEPIPDKYRTLIPLIDEPLPPGTDYLVPAIVVEEGERKIDAVLRQLKEGVESIQGSEQFRLFLTTMAKFHNYSLGNQILIALQKPEATRVAGFQTWKNLGRWVSKGATGIAILAPVLPPKPKKEEREEEEEVPLTPVYFKVVHVFDISQTEGKPLPEFDVPVLTGEANEELFAKALALAKAQGLEVDFGPMPAQDPSVKGFYSGKKIWVKPDEPQAQQLKTLLHEMAHYYSEGVFRIPRADAETIAESAAFAVGAHFGFDSGTRSFPYVALWARDDKVLKANLASIRKVVSTMLEGLEKGQVAMATVQADQVRGHLPIQTWQQYPRLNGKPVLPWVRETFGLARKEQMSSLKPVTAKHGTHIFGFLPDAGEYLGNIVVWDKGSWPAFEYYIETTMAEWATKMGVPSPEYFITDYDEDIILTTENKILIPKALVQAFRHDKPLGLLFAIAHEFGHWVAEARGLHINEAEEEAFANKTAEELSGVPWEDELVALHDILPKVYRKVSGGRSLRQAVDDVKAAKAKGNYLAKTIQDDKLVPALRKYDPHEFAEYVLRYNRFSDAEIPIYSGLARKSPLRVPDHIWREVIEATEGEFVKQGEINVFHIPEKERPTYMYAPPFGGFGKEALPEWITPEIKDLLSTSISGLEAKYKLPSSRDVDRTQVQSNRLVDLVIKAEEGARDVNPQISDPIWNVYKHLYSLMTDDEVAQYRRLKKESPGTGRLIPGTNPTGTCYQDAWRFLIKEKEGHLVHGTVWNGEKRIGHAWVEMETGYIWEPETKKFYTKLGFADVAAPVEQYRYTVTEASVMAARTKNFGPWSDKEVADYLKRKVPSVIPTKPARPSLKEEREFVSDSPEFLAFTIDDIGYRDKLDNAFEAAIAKVQRG